MKAWLISIAAVSLLTLSNSTEVFASQLVQPTHFVSSTPSTPDPGLSSDPGHPTHRLEINSSVQVSRETLRDAFVASREAYTKKLQRYAKCTPGEAKKTVAAAHPNMKIENLQLRNIRTNLVYMATVENEEDRFLVIVDAGNGKVLLDKPVPTHHERVFAEH